MIDGFTPTTTFVSKVHFVLRGDGVNYPHSQWLAGFCKADPRPWSSTKLLSHAAVSLENGEGMLCSTQASEEHHSISLLKESADFLPPDQPAHAWRRKSLKELCLWSPLQFDNYTHLSLHPRDHKVYLFHLLSF